MISGPQSPHKSPDTALTYLEVLVLERQTQKKAWGSLASQAEQSLSESWIQ